MGRASHMIADTKRRAQQAAHQANQSRTIALTCRVCGGSFITTGDRQNARVCGPECKKAMRLSQPSHFTKRTREQRQAERRRIAASKSKPYRPRSTKDDVAARKAQRTVELVANRAARVSFRLSCLPARREVERLRAKQRYLNNKGKKIASCAAYRKRMRAKPEYRAMARACVKRWVKRHPDRAKASHSARAARKRGAAFVEVVNRRVVFTRAQGICGICNLPIEERSWHVDHIIPLSKGGPHSYANTQAAHAVCNVRKSDSLPGHTPPSVGSSPAFPSLRVNAAQGTSRFYEPLRANG